ncbi:MAG: very short patch repair endonuclease [Planctomycetota bacterium]|nr:very short patch repair endonuclease [Planctomycetota bacterium]
MSAWRFTSVPRSRSRNMAAIRSRDTRPERIVRSLVHRLGYRFRLHVRDLEGRPDLVLPRHRLAIFVNGCFWHAHRCRCGRRCPKTNSSYWRAKRLRNLARDQQVRKKLRRQGWVVLTVWECQTKDLHRLEQRLRKFLKECP